MLVSLPCPSRLPGYGVNCVYLFADNENDRVKIGRTLHLCQRATNHKGMVCLAYIVVADMIVTEAALIQHFSSRFPSDYPAERSNPPERFRATELEAYEHFAQFAAMLNPPTLDLERLIARSIRKTTKIKAKKLPRNRVRLKRARKALGNWDYREWVNNLYPLTSDESDPFDSKMKPFRAEKVRLKSPEPYSYLEPYGGQRF